MERSTELNPAAETTYKTGNDPTKEAWMEFIETGDVKKHQVRSIIFNSWKRSRAAGVDPYEGHGCKFLGPAELERLLLQNKDLMDISYPFLKKIYYFLQGSGFMIMLADANGYILEEFGDPEIMERATELNFIKGACWQEQYVGTNSIGIIVHEKQTVQISGAEHYCVQSHGWTCSAAPVFDQNQKMIGIFNVSGPSESVNQHTLGMVVSSVEAIEQQMALCRQNKRIDNMNHRLENILNRATEAMITVDHDGRIDTMNQLARKLLGDFTNALFETIIVWQRIGQGSTYVDRRVLTSNFTDRELLIQTQNAKDPIPCLVSGAPILNLDGHFDGTVITLKPMEKVKKLVHKYNGNQAHIFFSDIIGKSTAIERTLQVARMAASNASTVLLQGESGTGKEMFAQAIHNASSRRNEPFVAVNCGAIPRDLIASELFGYSEGAFTGARRGGHPGKFEQAQGGTLFLDEIGDMPLDMQVNLLRALQERRITRVGDNKEIPIDVRIICATHRNLAVEVKKNNFRQDLFYRINVITIQIPPLRKRPEDIPMLFTYFAEQVCERNSFPVPRISEDLLKQLAAYHWPGNIRELQNTAERMVCLSNGAPLTPEQLPENLTAVQSVELAVPVPNENAPVSETLVAEPVSSVLHTAIPPVSTAVRNTDAMDLDTAAVQSTTAVQGTIPASRINAASVNSGNSASGDDTLHNIRSAKENLEAQNIRQTLLACSGNVSKTAQALGISRNSLYKKMHKYGIL